MTPALDRSPPLSLRTDVTGWHLLEPEHLLHNIAEALTPEFAGIFGPETIEAYVADAYQRIAHEARIKTYLPTLTARIAQAALIERARTQKDIHMTTTPEVLFVCVHNQGRSQMAAALLAHHAAGRVHVRSAGSAPADSVNPAVVEVMAEVGIDISQEFPKKLLTEDVAASDVVITMGCGDACPIFPGKRYEDWALNDPSGKGPDAVREIRDEIDQRVQKLLAELVAGTEAPVG
ncbi:MULTISPECIES: three-helix bundle dimerization domain-containing protein [unclassified Nocardioides]|uniref:arsenate reductase/protein-tyrosine-phosphatase family protein n=1 Tax=unclassified Nocardioides TaxID=2615069 RepID=UPI0009F0607E|nr:Putative arsenate reductase (ArsC) [Nocardioides sp. PD653-B2]GAW57075.1 putative arsenate reductase (ArsC) [Nocardioides sp. PD653]